MQPRLYLLPRRDHHGLTPKLVEPNKIYIYFENRKKKERDDWREEKMTTATQLGIEPGTSRFQGDCSTSEATGPGPTSTKSRSHLLPLQSKERKIANDTRFHTESTDVPGRPTQWNPLKLEQVGVVAKIFLERTLWVSAE